MESDTLDPGPGGAPEGADEGADLVYAAADAANTALRDAQTAARSAAAVAVATREAAKAAAAVAEGAGLVMTAAVAARASATRETAARAAAAIDLEAISRAADVAAAAAAALETIASEMHPEANEDDEGSDTATADTVAATVAAAATAEEKAAAEAAATVLSATAAAARTEAEAAEEAAATVDLATDGAAKSRRGVAQAAASSKKASDVVVDSTRRASHLAARVRTEAMQRSEGELRQATLVAELHDAIASDQLCLHYQPMYSIQTGALVAVEALLRWQHPSRGLLQPGQFLEVAEGRSLMNPIGDWVLTTAVAQAAAWRRSLGDYTPVMWVNISVEQLGRDHLTNLVEQLLSTSGLTRGQLGLEITERQLIRSAPAVAADLTTLRDMGVSLAVDDFGTGYASLDYLRRFAFDEIKIDRSFVAGLGHDKTDTAITSSIVALGRALDLSVVAEGVETQDQHDHLRELGCAVAQGYLLHRPAPAEIVSTLLDTDTDAAGASTT